jgi:cytochrome P450
MDPRVLDDPASDRNFFPFGAGPRSCAGEPLAWIEDILLIATIAQRWDLALEPGQSIELMPRITLRPRYGMKTRPERRARESA